MKLNLTSLYQAITSLDAALQEHKKQNNDFLRDSCIQRFEYTYELTWKILKRYLELSEPTGSLIDELSFSNLIRKGSEKGLLRSGWPSWKIFREARNATSHGYNQTKAQEVFAVIPDFYEEALYFYENLTKRLNQE